MANPDLVPLCAIAEMLGIKTQAMWKARPFLDEFPSGRKVGARTLYSVSETLAWASGKDVALAVRQALAADRSGHRDQRAGGINHDLCRRWAAGEFATEEQKQRFAFKSLVHRHCGGGQTYRVTVRPDWMND